MITGGVGGGRGILTRVQRVSVVGNSGSGKTTLARAVAAAIEAPHVEIDAIFHLPGWTQLPRDQLFEELDRHTSHQRWVVDGNYSTVLDLVWGRADTVVWLDLPRRQVMNQIVRRTIRRTITREELWNGNREHLRAVLHPDPRTSIIRWAWTEHAAYAERYATRLLQPQWSHLEVVRLRSRAEVADFVRDLG